MGAERAERTQREGAASLPAELSSFVGRADELAALEKLLVPDAMSAVSAPRDSHPRLVTLTGPGGIGKTRLALRAARLASHVFPDGVWLVELAALASSALVPRAATAALGIAESPEAEPEEALARALRDRRLLMVWDNCEHLLDGPPGSPAAGCATVAARLLERCPELRLLATSREPLGVPGETVLRVAPLALPAAGEDVLQSDAGRLLVERTRQAVAGFAVTAGNADVLAQLCARLDGIPLALELAAARMGVLAPEQLLARLEDRFRALGVGARTAPARQQTLRATLEWSHGLLSERERALFAWLGAFRGGFDLEAVEALAREPDPEAGALQPLAQLVAKSLVVAGAGSATDDSARVRYALLDTVRAYALERLAGRGEFEHASARHAAYYVALVERSEPELHGPRQARWLRRLDAEHGNVRAALDCLVSQGDVGGALRLGAAVWWFWLVRGFFREGYERLSALLALSQGAEEDTDEAVLRGRLVVAAAALLRGQLLVDADYLVPEGHASGEDEAFRHMAGALLTAAERFAAHGETRWQAYALHTLAEVTHLTRPGRSDLTDSDRLFEEAHRLALVAGDHWLAAYSRNALGATCRGRERERARRCFEEALATRQRLGDVWGTATSLSDLGQLAQAQGDVATAQRYYEHSLALRREVGDARGLLHTLYRLAHAATVAGEHAAARAYLEEARPIGRRLGPMLTDTHGQLLDGLVALGEGRHGAARELLLASLDACHARGWSTAPALHALARTAAAAGRWRRALLLAGAATGSAASRRPWWGLTGGPDDAALERALQPARAALGMGYAAAWQQGAAWPLEATLRYAHSTEEVPGESASSVLSALSASRGKGRPLTARELQVAALVAQGLTNRQIAAELIISERTAARHVEHILHKLGFAARAQVGTWMGRRKERAGD